MKSKIITTVTCSIFIIFNIVWYLYPILYTKCINNIPYIFLRYLLFFGIPIILLIISIFLWYKYLKNKSKYFYIVSFFNVLIIALNIYMLSYIIMKKLNCNKFDMYISIVQIINMFIIMAYIFRLIKILYELSYTLIVFISIFACALGWFSIKEKLFISVLFIILNTFFTMENQENLLIFLEKAKIGNKKIWNLNNHNGLDEKEQAGRFIAQKIFFYILILIVYIALRVTEDKYFILNIFFKEKIDTIPLIIKYIYRGLDRLIIFAAVGLLYFCKPINEIIKKLFYYYNK